MRDGYRVYHDLPAGKFNIDHIVVCSSGVFAVETKSVSKPTSKNRKADAKVKYGGKCLRFPNGTNIESLEQAKLHAERLFILRLRGSYDTQNNCSWRRKQLKSK